MSGKGSGRGNKTERLLESLKLKYEREGDSFMLWLWGHYQVKQKKNANAKARIVLIESGILILMKDGKRVSKAVLKNPRTYYNFSCDLYFYSYSKYVINPV